MALAGEMLREFLIGLSFSVNEATKKSALNALKELDEASQKTTDNQKKRDQESEKDKKKIENEEKKRRREEENEEKKRTQELERQNKKRAQDHEDAVKRMAASINNHLSSTIRSLVQAITTVAGAVAGVRAVQSFVVDMGQLADLSKKTSSAAGDIKAISESFQALGSTRGAGIQAIEGIFSSLQRNSGLMSAMRVLGVTETKNTTIQLEQLSKGLRQIVQQYGMDRAILRGEQFGLSEEAVRVLADPKFDSELGRIKKLHSDWRDDATHDTKVAKEVLKQWADLSIQAGTVRDKILTSLLLAINPFLTKLNRELKDNSSGLSKSLDDLIISVNRWSDENGDKIIKWVKDFLDPENINKGDIWKNLFRDIVPEADRVKESVTAIATGIENSVKFAQELWRTMNLAADLISMRHAGPASGLALEGMALDPNTTPSPGTVGPPAPPIPVDRRPSLLSWWQGPGRITDEDKVRGRYSGQFYGPNIDEMKGRESLEKFSKGTENLVKGADKLDKATEGQGGTGFMARMGQGLLNMFGIGGGSGMPGGFIGEGGGGGGGAAGGGGGGGGGRVGIGEQGVGGRISGPGMKVAQRLVGDLQKELGLTKEQAEGAAGSLAAETGGFSQLQEIKPRGGRGGLGYAQWTGPRRRAFEAWARQNNLDVSSYEANKGFLVHELQTSQTSELARLRQAGNREQAARIFTGSTREGVGFLRPGAEHYGSSVSLANRIAAGQTGTSGTGFDDPAVAAKVQQKLDETDPVKRGAAQFKRPRLSGEKIQNIEDNANRLNGGANGSVAPSPLSSNSTANDNSIQVSQNNEYNTTIHAADASGANSMFRRSMEVNAGMALGQAKTALR